MPRKHQKADARISEIKDKFVERVSELWEQHESEFMEVLEDAESRKVVLSFAALLDFSESTAKLETKIRFSQVITDKKADDFDDPSQPRLPGTEDEEETTGKRGKKPKGNGRRKKDLETSDAESMPG